MKILYVAPQRDSAERAAHALRRVGHAVVEREGATRVLDEEIEAAERVAATEADVPTD